MSNSTLSLPVREAPPTNIARRTTYTAGQRNVFQAMRDGEIIEGFLEFDAARLIGVTGRIQPVTLRDEQGNETGRVNRLVVRQEIILDGLQVGKFVKGNPVPHPLCSDPRYEDWRDADLRPHRVAGHQWVQKPNVPLVLSYVNYLQENCGFAVRLWPEKPKGSRRNTRDAFQARPAQRIDRNNRRAYGATLDSFEVSVNPEYKDGFKDWLSGLDEQLARWESAEAQDDEDIKSQLLDSISQNIHYVGGVFTTKSHETWPRPVDVGGTTINGQLFTLYRPGGQPLTADVFKALGEIPSETPAAPLKLTASDLSAPDYDASADDPQPF